MPLVQTYLAFRSLQLLKFALQRRVPDVALEVGRGNCNIIPIHDVMAVSELQLGDMDKIADYFGPQVAYYFYFMNLYKSFLFYAALIGIAINVYMKVSGAFLCSLFGIFMVLWGTVFCSVCERRAYRFSYKYSLLKRVGTRLSEKIRPDFRGEERISPITDKLELHVHWADRVLKQFCSNLVSFLFLTMAHFCMMCAMNAKGHVNDTGINRIWYIDSIAKLYRKGNLFSCGTLVLGRFEPISSDFIVTMLHFAVIKILNASYVYILEYLVEFENHRTLEEHENSFIWKRFLFEAVDSYGSLMFLAFVKCNMKALRNELKMLFILDAMRRFMFETVTPLIVQVVVNGRRSLKLKLPKKQACFDKYDSFDDWNEIIIQYGYIALFASAFPLGPALSWLANEIECRHDLFSLKYVYQRPFPVNMIGPWVGILRAITILSVLSNSAIISVSSDQLYTMYSTLVNSEISSTAAGLRTWGLAVCFLLEHVIGAVVLLIWYILPSMPEDISNKLKHEAYLAMNIDDKKKDKPVSGDQAAKKHRGQLPQHPKYFRAESLAALKPQVPLYSNGKIKGKHVLTPLSIHEMDSKRYAGVTEVRIRREARDSTSPSLHHSAVPRRTPQFSKRVNWDI